ncbi:MAG: hypothetical protein GX654_13440 [Desulfatiglans sp.]|nr:hypothetical protein [Desulfatiglans sp.]
MAESLKEINYRGGVVKFNIPSNWVEEYEETGGGTFYEDAPNTGTLRLNIITMQAPSGAKGNLPFSALSSIPVIENKNIEMLANGNAFAYSVSRSEEDGEKITLYWWYLANQVGSSHIRLANFSYTILTSKEDDQKTKEEIKLLEVQIRKTIFHPGLGK